MDIGAVSFREENGIEVVIYPQGDWDDIDFDATIPEENTDMIAYGSKKDASKKGISLLDIATSVDGKKILRIRETVMYTCRKKTDGKNDSDLISKELFFQNEKSNKFLKVTSELT